MNKDNTYLRKTVLSIIWELNSQGSIFTICSMLWSKILCKRKKCIDSWLLSWEISLTDFHLNFNIKKKSILGTVKDVGFKRSSNYTKAKGSAQMNVGTKWFQKPQVCTKSSIVQGLSILKNLMIVTTSTT